MKNCGGLFDIVSKSERIAELEYEMGRSDFWNDVDKAQKIAQEVTLLKNAVDSFTSISSRIEDAKLLVVMAIEEDEQALLLDIAQEVKLLTNEIENLELATLLRGEYDKNNAILTIHAGAGGTEAQDWAQMLLRMYTRFSDSSNYKMEVLDYLAGDEAGLKSATIQITGMNAYGYLKSEKGVHRLVRISPFDSNARRHTSFAAIDVMPEIEDNIEVAINPVDLRVDTYRASGAGGQHVNKTDSAVRMTHLPTGIIVQCQSERSQIQNRERCMKLLRAKIFELEQLKKEQLISGIAGEYQAIEWGSQIRSYVFHPYNMVKDHRTSAETSNVQAVMDGDLDMFIQAYLRKDFK